MPITKSAKKALNVSQRKRKINLKWKDNIKKSVKEVKDAIKAKKNEDAKKALIKAQKILDKATKNRIIHRNKANRLKSRLFEAVKKTIAKK